ncbi:40S ribosomal protein S10 (nucleomorph) [Lotharella oceanica]|uniref:40S ribosomal protein S10 n=1 Tax=Lotharella oceanica TaxID=641309 RepID=A0A060DAY4_9EUKA|nr:40S ribosomal protein S10 [Lotharella oceanica]
MHISKRILTKIMEKFINEGVYIIAKLRISEPIYNSNINTYQVFKIIKSLKTRKLIHEVHCWSFYYWTLTRKGYKYIKNYLRIF